MGGDMSEGIRGTVTGDGVNAIGVSYVLYADDLSLTINDPGEMQAVLNRSCYSLPAFMYGDVALPEKEQFKCLGMFVDKHMDLK
eukprot:380860-Pelagomonas_calceolata.AAC.1